MSRKNLARWVQFVTILCFPAGCGGGPPAQNATPIISGIFPDQATAGGSAFTLTVEGLEFISTSVVYWNGAPRPTTYNTTNGELTATIAANEIAQAGTAQVTVVTPAPGGGVSAGFDFFINPVSNPVPKITSISPASAAAGGPAFTLTVDDNASGTGFANTSVVNWNGQPLTTKFVSTAQLTAQISQTDIAMAGTAVITVTTPTPGGGASNAVDFQITDTPASILFPMVISVAANHQAPDGPSSWPGMDATGRFVAFISSARNVVTGAAGSVYVRDTCLGTAAQCSPQTYAVDLAANGSAPDAQASTVAISSNGRFVAFSSSATNLVSPGTNGFPQIFLRDTCLGAAAPAGCRPATILVSRSAIAAEANKPSLFPAINADGRFVSFASKATNLVDGVPHGAREIYLRDTCIGASASCTPNTFVASADVDGRPGRLANLYSAISADGRYVAFDSVSSDSFTGVSGAQIYLRDTCVNASLASCEPSTELVSVANNGDPADGRSEAPSMSADGQWVGFVSKATNLASGSKGQYEVYLRKTCIGVKTGCVPSTWLISSGANGAAGNGDSRMAGISSSGRYVSFTSNSTNLASMAAEPVSHVYVHDTCLGANSNCVERTALVSVSASGLLGNDASGAWLVPMPISSDGRFAAFFSLATNLVSAGQISGKGDVFLVQNPLQ